MAASGRRSDRLSVGFDPDMLDRPLPETDLNSRLLTGSRNGHNLRLGVWDEALFGEKVGFLSPSIRVW